MGLKAPSPRATHDRSENRRSISVDQYAREPSGRCSGFDPMAL